MPTMERMKPLRKRQWLVLGLIFAAFLSMLLWYGPTNNWSWDPSFYYAQLRSPIIDNDLDFRSETKTSGIATPYTVTGLQGSPWPIGPSIFWSPFFLAAHLVVSLIDPAKATGFSSPYIAFVSFGSAMYGMAGLYILYKICRRYGDRFISAVTLLLCFGATPLFYYIYHQTIMAHSTGFMVAAATYLIYILLTRNEMDHKWSGLIFGVMIGLNFLMRWAGLLFAVFPLMFYARRVQDAVKEHDQQKVRHLLTQVLIAMLSFGLTITPQLALWQRLYGSFLVMPQGPEAFVGGILPVNTLKVFFDTNRGLLFWCPFVLLGMVGMFRIPEREIRWSTLACMLLQVIVIGYRADWFSGGGFGARYFVELLPLVAVGFICLAQGLARERMGRVALLLLTASLILHQSVLMYAVEQTANGWLDIQAYLKGRPLGVRWQITSFLNLMRHPGLWLVPRSFISEQRQAILINFLDGVRDLRAYFVTAVAAILTPLAIAAGAWMSKLRVKVRLPMLLTGVMGIMLGWSIYLMLVG